MGSLSTTFLSFGPVLLLSCMGAKGQEDSGGTDADGDGYQETHDCDDLNANVHPNAQEVCDEIDNNCDGAIDEPGASGETTWYGDADADSYGDPDNVVSACDQPFGYVADGTDCGPADEDTHPGANEICDGTDNDCNGSVDDNAVDAGTWYADWDSDGYGDPTDSTTGCDQPLGYVAEGTDCDDSNQDLHPETYWYSDADGDGFGDADAVDQSCTAPAGYVAEGTDCDDGDSAVYPGAPEYCDALDNDCDATTTEVGLASFVDSNGVWTDATATLSGTPSSPVLLNLSEGTYNICEGTWYINARISANVSLVGLGTENTVILDGGGAESVVFIDTDGLAVELTDLTLSNGSAGDNESFFNYYLAGGGVFCEGAGTDLLVTGVTVSGNTADMGGGIYAGSGCTLTMEASTVTDNEALWAAGIELESSDHQLSNSTISNNVAQAGGGGLYLVNFSETGGVTMTLDTVEITDNQAGWGGGLQLDATKEPLEVECVGGSSTTAGITDNLSTQAQYGAVHLLDSGEADWTFNADLCDFGTASSGDNDALDLTVYDSLGGFIWPYMAGDDASFECSSTENQCGSVDNYTLGDTTYESSQSESLFILNMLEADSDATLNSFSIYTDLDASCSVDLLVLSTGSYDTGDSGEERTLEVVWSQASANDGTGTRWVDSEDVGIVLESGTYYGLAAAIECAYSGHSWSYFYDLAQSSTDIGAGQTLGYMFSDWSGTSYEEGDQVELVSYGPGTYTAPFYMQINVTEL